MLRCSDHSLLSGLGFMSTARQRARLCLHAVLSPKIQSRPGALERFGASDPEYLPECKELHGTALRCGNLCEKL